ncbi:IclR family transcriptional regulator domain-containing protein [Streptomyces hyaluromycini]|uniref:IclR family transcriptional regulator domain-containing protein n=1 Tax=Streptomyces hyaluromycini TaxID=1377993 RepID=UPI000B5CA8EE|nr:IclR family transcriptional regulator C-terminal domain-containing protein [Streptomyces hyaluromycini]
MSRDARAPHFVRSFERGLAVIRAFDAEHPARTLSEVARACDLTRAAARRLLLTLADLGYVHSDGRHFRLAPRVLELGYAYLSGLELPNLAQPHLVQLAELAGESAALCLLDGDAVVPVAAARPRRVMAATIAVGARFPAYGTAVGRVLLADLTQPGLCHADVTRRQECALLEGDPEAGVSTLAAPVRDRSGRVVAGVSLAMHSGRTSTVAARRDLLPHLLAAVARIEVDLRITDPAPDAPPGTATRR